MKTNFKMKQEKVKLNNLKDKGKFMKKCLERQDIVLQDKTVLVSHSCPILCNHMDCSPLGSSVHVILQARIQEWVAIPFSRGSFQPRDRTQVSHIVGRCFLPSEPPGKSYIGYKTSSFFSANQIKC